MKWTFVSADAGSAYTARDGLLQYLASRAARGSDIEAAAIIFGELVGNVVRHAPGPIAIELSWKRGIAVLRVADHGPGYNWNGAATLPEITAESGRGLFIVHKVARRLRVAHIRGKGTVATAWLPVMLDRRFRATGT